MVGNLRLLFNSLQGKTVTGGRLNLNKAVSSVSKPTITISATDASAAETLAGQTANSGRFTLTRTGNLSSALIGKYAMANRNRFLGMWGER